MGYLAATKLGAGMSGEEFERGRVFAYVWPLLDINFGMTSRNSSRGGMPAAATAQR